MVTATKYRDHAGDDHGHRVAKSAAVRRLLEGGEDQHPDEDIGKLPENGGEEDQVGGMLGDGFKPSVGVAAAEEFGEAAAGIFCAANRSSMEKKRESREASADSPDGQVEGHLSELPREKPARCPVE